MKPLKSFKEWKNERMIAEFVGPAGQVDPMSMQPSAAQQPTAVAAQAAQPENEHPLVARLVKSLSTRPATYVMQMQRALNQQLQQVIADKSSSAGRRNAYGNFAMAKSMKSNVGQQSQI